MRFGRNHPHKTNGKKRSGQWVSIRKEHLQKFPECEVCGAKQGDKGYDGKPVLVEVHHIKPFHEHPELELKPQNLITLCERSRDGSNHHLLIGHADNFKGWNPDVVVTASILKHQILANKKRIKAR